MLVAATYTAVENVATFYFLAHFYAVSTTSIHSRTVCFFVQFCAVSTTPAPFYSLVNSFAFSTAFASIVASQAP